MENRPNISIDAKIIFKHGDTYYWDNDNGEGVNYIPDEGEMIIYDAEEGGCEYSRVKYGNGIDTAKSCLLAVHR